MLPNFRFWNKEEKKMYEVLSVHISSGMVEVAGGEYLLTPQDSSLMKATGMVDVYANGIYQGDIVKIADREYEVKYGSHNFSSFKGIGFYLAHHVNEDTVAVEAFDPHVNMEIVGNIYDNPEKIHLPNDWWNEEDWEEE